LFYAQREILKANDEYTTRNPEVNHHFLQAPSGQEIFYKHMDKMASSALSMIQLFDGASSVRGVIENVETLRRLEKIAKTFFYEEPEKLYKVWNMCKKNEETNLIEEAMDDLYEMKFIGKKDEDMKRTIADADDVGKRIAVAASFRHLIRSKNGYTLISKLEENGIAVQREELIKLVKSGFDSQYVPRRQLLDWAA